MKNPLAWAVCSIRDRGVGRTVAVAHSSVCDWWFDRWHHTDTNSINELATLEIASDNLRFGHKYQASKAKPLRQLLTRLQLPRNSVFVDFGSGKGKAMLIALEFPFRRIVGVEFSSELCAIARHNLLRCIDDKDQERLFVIECDAAEYEFRDDENVLYFYNPFECEVIEQVLIRLEESLLRRPRNVWLLYFASLHPEAFDRSKIIELEAELVLGGTDCRIYCHRTPVVREANEIPAEGAKT